MNVRALLVAAAAFASGACSPEPALPVARTAHLEPTEDVSAGQRTIALELDAESGFERWETESARKVKLGPSPILDSSGPPAVNFRGRQVKSMRCPGPFDPSAVNMVEIELLSAGHTRLFAWFERDGERATPDTRAFIEWTELPTTIRLRFLGNQLETEPFDSFNLRFSGEGHHLSIFRIRWLHDSGFEEHESRPLEFVYLGDDGRRANAVTTRSPHFSMFEVGDGSELSFSYGVPREFFHARAGLELALQLKHESGAEREVTFPFPCDEWAFARVDLSDWPRGEVEAVAHTRAREGFESLGFVTPLWVGEPNATPKTVLFITSDTHRADHLGAARSGVPIETPALNRLAESGVLYEQAWSTTNVTIPSHAALMTGLHPRDTFVIDNRTSLADRAQTLAEHFTNAGYTSFALVSARHLDSWHSGLGQGFERMHAASTGTRPAEETVGVLLDWLDEADRRPLFVWLHLFDAHAPYSHREPWNEQYLSTATPGPAGFIDVNTRFRAHYRSEISYLDRELDALLQRARFEDAVIAFTADHGESLGAHGIDFQHLELYPDTTHVPLILRWPDCPPGLRVRGAVHQLDLGRTLLDLAGVEAPDFPGRSLPVAEEAPDLGPVHTLNGLGDSAARLEDGWLLILHLQEHEIPGDRGRRFQRHEVELFHFAEDPECTEDLREAQPAKAEALRASLIEWLRAAAPEGLAKAADLDPEDLQALVELGYTGREPEDRTSWFPDRCDCENCRIFTD